MSKETKFIQLGLKKNGRIVKNAQYILEGFIENILEMGVSKGVTPRIRFSDLFFPKRLSLKVGQIRDVGYRAGYNSALEDVEQDMSKLIDADEFGRNKK